MTLKIAFDIGGVISKYPDVFRHLAMKLAISDTLIGPTADTHNSVGSSVEIYVISDMHDVDLMHSMLARNGFYLAKSQIFSADYETYGEYCKTKLCEELGIDILIDDFVGYLAEGSFVRLLVMPNARQPYYHDTWKTIGDEDAFGRRKYHGDEQKEVKND